VKSKRWSLSGTETTRPLLPAKKFTTALNRPAEIVRVLLAANAFVVASLADAPLDVLLVLLKEHPEALADIYRNELLVVD